MPSRRRLLQLASASAAGVCLAGASWGKPSFSSNPFSLGVASGSPTSDSVVLWTRIMSPLEQGTDLGVPAIALRWELAHDEQFSRLVQSGQTQALAELGHSVHVEVSGLGSDRWYFYRFILGDWVSATGRTRSFPLANAKVNKLRLAYASCQKWEDGYFSAWRHMRQEALDAVLFLGDYIYEYPARHSKLRVPDGGWVLTLADYRQRYAQYKSDADLQAMHAACPWLMVWDDHEVQNDYAGTQAGSSGATDPAIAANFLARRAAAYQAYYEHMPLPSSVLTKGLTGLGQGAEMRIYTRASFGQLAALYMLDGRQYKDPQPCTKDAKPGSGLINPLTCDALNDPMRSLLGAQQERWLYSELANSRTRQSCWNVLAQSTLFGQRKLKSGPGQLFWNDGWDGYPQARKRFTQALQQHAVSNPVILGGDVHENWVGYVKADYSDPRSASLGVEFCGTSITSRSNAVDHSAEQLANNPHFVFADAQHRGYGVLEFTPKQLNARLRVLDDVSHQDSKVSTLAEFVVQAGQTLLQKL